jgi:ankyrin repeat protein
MFRSLYEWATKEKTDAIVKAAKEHDIHKVKKLLKKGVDVNAREKDEYDQATEDSGFTALYRACEEATFIRNQTECITTLLEAKADPNCKSRLNTPLVEVMSAYQGNTTHVKLLLKYKADVNLANRDDRRTPLHAAAIHDKDECLNILLESKADPNAKDREGFTALQLAKERDCKDAVKVMTDFFKQAENKKETVETPKKEAADQTVTPAMSPRPA